MVGYWSHLLLGNSWNINNNTFQSIWFWGRTYISTNKLSRLQVATLLVLVILVKKVKFNIFLFWQVVIFLSILSFLQHTLLHFWRMTNPFNCSNYTQVFNVTSKSWSSFANQKHAFLNWTGISPSHTSQFAVLDISGKYGFKFGGEKNKDYIWKQICSVILIFSKYTKGWWLSFLFKWFTLFKFFHHINLMQHRGQKISKQQTSMQRNKNPNKQRKKKIIKNQKNLPHQKTPTRHRSRGTGSFIAKCCWISLKLTALYQLWVMYGAWSK